MNNNNLLKRYFSPKRVFLYSVVALVHVLYAQASDGSAAMTVKKAYGSAKNSAGRMEDDAFFDAVSRGVLDFSRDTDEEIDDEGASSAGEGPVFRDVISERSGHRGSGFPAKGGFDRDQGVDMTSENDTEKDGGSKDETSKFWPTFEIENEVKDPFDKDDDDFDEDRRYEIPGLMKSSARMTKFSAFSYILTLSVFLLVKYEAFI